MSTSFDIYNQWSGLVYTYIVEVILSATPIKVEVCRPTGIKEVAGSILGSGHIAFVKLIMK